MVEDLHLIYLMSNKEIVVLFPKIIWLPYWKKCELQI